MTKCVVSPVGNSCLAEGGFESAWHLSTKDVIWQMIVVEEQGDSRCDAKR